MRVACAGSPAYWDTCADAMAVAAAGSGVGNTVADHDVGEDRGSGDGVDGGIDGGDGERVVVVVVVADRLAIADRLATALAALAVFVEERCLMHFHSDIDHRDTLGWLLTALFVTISFQ